MIIHVDLAEPENNIQDLVKLLEFSHIYQEDPEDPTDCRIVEQAGAKTKLHLGKITSTENWKKAKHTKMLNKVLKPIDGYIGKNPSSYESDLVEFSSNSKGELVVKRHQKASQVQSSRKINGKYSNATTIKRNGQKPKPKPKPRSYFDECTINKCVGSNFRRVWQDENCQTVQAVDFYYTWDEWFKNRIDEHQDAKQ